MSEYLKMIKLRRSNYAMDSQCPLDEGALAELIKSAIRETPSPFNSQSPRAALLFGEHSKKFWDIVLQTLLKRVKPERAEGVREKIAGFAAAFGTVLYFEDTAVTKSLMTEYPSYADKFETWAQHANAIAQFAVWTALCEQGLAANLQHYNPIIDDEVKAAFSLPESWQLVAQMPFGRKLAEAEEKEYQDIDSRTRTFLGG